MVSTLLIITVVGVGGPPRPAPTPPDVLANGAITVVHGGHVVATTETGRLRRHVRPGDYEISAALPSIQCQRRHVVVKRRVVRLTLNCSIE
jgi:hypothetical protein